MHFLFVYYYNSNFSFVIYSLRRSLDSDSLISRLKIVLEECAVQETKASFHLHLVFFSDIIKYFVSFAIHHTSTTHISSKTSQNNLNLQW